MSNVTIISSEKNWMVQTARNQLIRAAALPGVTAPLGSLTCTPAKLLLELHLLLKVSFTLILSAMTPRRGKLWHYPRKCINRGLNGKVNLGGEIIMVDTSDQAELQNCIANAQNVLMEMGPVIDRISGQSEKNQLKELCYKAGTLLKEAHQRL
jgi:hypothetical protein